MNNSGTLVIAPVRPQSTEDVYPSAVANEILGGYKTFETIVLRNALPAERRTEGEMCYVIETDSFYILKGGITDSDWVTTDTDATWGDIGGTLSNQTDLQTALDAKVPKTTQVNGHSLSADVTVTKSDVGLGNADNTSDANKPVSTAQGLAIAVVQNDVDAHEARTDNPHAVTKTQVGLSNADNTSDANKPVSSAMQTALDLKQAFTPRVISTADDDTAVIDLAVTDIYQLTAIENNTTFSLNGVTDHGRVLIIRIKDAGVTKTLTWGAIFRVFGVALPSVTVANKWMYVAGRYDATENKLDVLAVGVES